MGKDIVVLEAGEVEADAHRQEAEASLRGGHPALALEHGVELGLQRVQVEHVGGGIVLLLVGELVRRPVGALLLLRQVDAEKLGTQVLEAMAIGIGARQLGGDGAVDRPGRDLDAGKHSHTSGKGKLETAGPPAPQTRRRPILAVETDEIGRCCRRPQAPGTRARGSPSVSVSTR